MMETHIVNATSVRLGRLVAMAVRPTGEAQWLPETFSTRMAARHLLNPSDLGIWVTVYPYPRVPTSKTKNISMAPLVVIRHKSAQVEFHAHRLPLRRAVHFRMEEPENDPAELLAVRESAPMLFQEPHDQKTSSLELEEAQDGDSGDASMRLSERIYSQQGMRPFSCAQCGSVVADREDLVAKTFFGKSGKAFLLDNM